MSSSKSFREMIKTAEDIVRARELSPLYDHFNNNTKVALSNSSLISNSKASVFLEKTAPDGKEPFVYSIFRVEKSALGFLYEMYICHKDGENVAVSGYLKVAMTSGDAELYLVGSDTQRDIVYTKEGERQLDKDSGDDVQLLAHVFETARELVLAKAQEE